MNSGLRPLCVQCKTNPRAMGYRRGTKIYWRRHCDTCIRKNKNLKIGGITPLQRSGYTKKRKCELCGFKAREQIQLDVLFIDGNKNNTNDVNLKTVCANCQRLASVKRLRWTVGDLEVDG
jgi:hypothetical protein